MTGRRRAMRIPISHDDPASAERRRQRVAATLRARRSTAAGWGPCVRCGGVDVETAIDHDTGEWPENLDPCECGPRRGDHWEAMVWAVHRRIRQREAAGRVATGEDPR